MYVCMCVCVYIYGCDMYKAFEIMVNKGISGLAVVDEDGIIIHNTSTSDLKVGCVYVRANIHAYKHK
jgi:hypothetical protein